MMSKIVVMKCTKYPGICKRFKNFLEIFDNVNVINIIKLVLSGHLCFLKKVSAKARCPLRITCSLWTGFTVLYFLSANEERKTPTY